MTMVIYDPHIFILEATGVGVWLLDTLAISHLLMPVVLTRNEITRLFLLMHINCQEFFFTFLLNRKRRERRGRVKGTFIR